MQIQCVICSDLITQNAIADIIGLACGHIFHGLCLRTWLDRSATCPHCRAKASTNKQYKVYLTIAAEPEGQDIVTLTRSVDNLKYELKLKNMECSTLAKDLDTYKTRSSNLVKEVRNLESKICSAAEITLQLNEQRKFANCKARELSEAKFIIESLQNEMKQYQTLKAMVQNSNAELSTDIDTQALDSSQLTFLLSTFKKDISRLTKMDEDLKKALSKSENEKLSIIKKNEALQDEICIKDIIIESLKETVEKNKIKAMSFKKKVIPWDPSVLDSSDVSITEYSSPLAAPTLKRSTSFTSEEPPTKQLHVRKPAEVIKVNHFSDPKTSFRITSDRKYAVGQLATSLKSSSSLDNCNSNKSSNVRKTIFPNKYKPEVGVSSDSAGVKITGDFELIGEKFSGPLKPSSSSSGFKYDGLGGHSKKDVFPSGYRPHSGLIKTKKRN